MKPQAFCKRVYFNNLTYKLLLTYHNPAGNTVKTWTSYYMKMHILLVRNNIQILDLTHTIIQVRKSLNAVFQRIKYRGSFLIYARTLNALKLSHATVFIFADEWLPGLITNYKRTIIPLYTHKKYNEQMLPVLTRPQLEIKGTIKYHAVPKASSKKIKRRIPPVPAISLSVLDNYTWLNECHNLGIPSIQLCDTQSTFDRITYPIISNQRSVPFSYFIIHLFAETCNSALLDTRLYFKSYYNKFEDFYQPDINNYRKRFWTKPVLYIKNDSFGIPQTTLVKFSYKRRVKYITSKPYNIISQKTFLYNVKQAQYRVEEYVKTPEYQYNFFNKAVYHSFAKQLFGKLIKIRCWLQFFIRSKTYRLYIRHNLHKLSNPYKRELYPLKREQRWYLKRTRIMCRDMYLKDVQKKIDTVTQRRNRDGLLYAFRVLFYVIRSYKDVRWYPYLGLLRKNFVHLLGLKKALRRKRLGKYRFLTKIPLYTRDLRSLFIYSFFTFLNLKSNIPNYKKSNAIKNKKIIYHYETYT